MAYGLYAADGSINVTVVDGSSWTGLYAKDGSWNVKARSTEYGAYASCGALLVTLQASAVNGDIAPDGSLNVSVTPFQPGTFRITVVTGSFGPPPTGAYYPWLFF